MKKTRPAAPSRPRNPLVAPLLFRQAGAHRRSPGGIRQAQHAVLRRELARMGPLPDPHSP